MTKIAVISDVHSNVTALKESISLIEKSGIDVLVFLGDLLTYGCNVNETVDFLLDYSNKRTTIFIKGNHDQMYFNIQNGKDFEYKKLPDFLMESILMTSHDLKYKLIDVFEWENSTVLNNVFFSHANALKFGDWSYLNTEKEIASSAEILLSNKYYGGVFGHTHRSKLLTFDKGGGIDTDVDFLEYNSNNSSCFVANSGSVGQPRGSVSSFLLLTLESQRVSIKRMCFSYDVDKHKAFINKSFLSTDTKEKLLSYYN